MTHSNHDQWGELSDREAAGEALSPGELRFLREFAETDPLAHAETELWESMAALAPLGDELGDRALADRAVRIALSERRATPVGRRAWLRSAGGAFAVAAAAAIFVLSRGSGGPSVVEYVASAAQAGGAHVEKGAHLAVGSEIVAIGGPVCVAVEPRIHACLASGSKVRLSQVGVAERRVDLLAGRVAVALDPLPKGQRFSVVANGVWSTAVGTAFTVALEPAGGAETVVHEGKVAVGAERSGEIVGAHKIGLSDGGSVKVEQLGSHARTETPEWAALGSVAQRSIEAKMDAPVAEANVEPEQALQVSPDKAAPVAPAPEPVPRRLAPLAQKVTATSADLLSAARQALRDQRWHDAAKSYQQIAAAYPASPEAHTVLVPLARLEVDRLGQPAVALKHLDAYLAVGGPLAVEARLARIRAYRALGRATDEAHAIDEFLGAHPGSLEAEKLRERRAALGGR
jgi:hypothetical protein